MVDSKPVVFSRRGVVGVVLVVGVLVLLAAAVDAKYVPMVSGLMTLGGVYVAYRVLRFQVEAQANPLVLEHYKKQSEMLVTLGALATRLHNLTRYPQRPQAEDSQEAIAKAHNDLYEFLDDNIVLMAEESIRMSWDLVQAVRIHRVRGENANSLDEFNATLEPLDNAHKMLLDYCRNGVQSKELSNAALNLINSRGGTGPGGSGVS